MKFNSKLVKPQVNEISDKFSWNLYRLFKIVENEMKKFKSLDYKIYWYKKSSYDGEIVEFNPDKSLHLNHIMMVKIYPDNQGMVSVRFGSIMGKTPREKIEFFASAIKSEYMIDITDWFWKEYQKIGRCIFDREHNGWWQGGDSRFTSINKNSRKCNWCGQHQKRQIKKRVMIERKEKWVS